MEANSAASEQKIGGHILRSFDLTKTGQHHFASAPYFYYHQALEAEASLEFLPGSMNTVFVLHAGAQSWVESQDKKHALTSNEVVQIEGVNAKFHAGTERLELFVAGVRKTPSSPVFKIVPETEVKQVSKPWGYEMWLNSEHPEYAFKKIFLRAGTRTSLQYHQFKRETNLIYRGEARLHYKGATDVPNNDVKPDDVAQLPLHPASVIDVFPMGLHRIEAISDVLLYEVSTPHLNDVIRVSDDTNRPDGRIAQEHGKQ